MLVFNCAVCLGFFGWQLVFKILEHLLYIVVKTYKIVQLFFQKPNDLGFSTRTLKEIKLINLFMTDWILAK